METFLSTNRTDSGENLDSFRGFKGVVTETVDLVSFFEQWPERSVEGIADEHLLPGPEGVGDGIAFNESAAAEEAAEEDLR